MASNGRFVGELNDWEGPLGHKRPTGIMLVLGGSYFAVSLRAEEGALAVEGNLLGGKAPRALCAESRLLLLL